MGSCVSDAKKYSQSTSGNKICWMDSKIYWDTPDNPLVLCPGEKTLHTFEEIEDARGQNGFGNLTVTNLRVMWIHTEKTNLNISIGFGTILYIHFNMIKSTLLGRVRSPYIMTQFKNSRYDFIFADKANRGIQIFNILDSALRRYRATQVFRVILSRDISLMDSSGKCNYFYGENFVMKIDPCRHIVKAAKREGAFYMTDRRIIWIGSEKAKCWNLSIPYIQLKLILLKPLRNGISLVIHTNKEYGSHIFAFYAGELELVRRAFKELERLHTDAYACPFFGPVDGTIQYEDSRFYVVAPMSQVTDEIETPTYKAKSWLRDATSPRFITVENVDCEIDSSDMSQLHESTKDWPLTLLEQPQAFNSLPEFKHSHSHETLNYHSLDQDTTQCSSQADEFSQLFTMTQSSFLDISCQPCIPQLNQAAGRRDYHFLPPDVLAVGRFHSAIQHQANTLVVDQESSDKTQNLFQLQVRRCTMCMFKDSEVAFDPCGHLCSCRNCATKLKQCPLCRTDISKVLKVFL